MTDFLFKDYWLLTMVSVLLLRMTLGCHRDVMAFRDEVPY